VPRGRGLAAFPPPRGLALPHHPDTTSRALTLAIPAPLRALILAIPAPLRSTMHCSRAYPLGCLCVLLCSWAGYTTALPRPTQQPLPTPDSVLALPAGLPGGVQGLHAHGVRAGHGLHALVRLRRLWRRQQQLRPGGGGLVAPP